jgi:hypothetical protein
MSGERLDRETIVNQLMRNWHSIGMRVEFIFKQWCMFEEV